MIIYEKNSIYSKNLTMTNIREIIAEEVGNFDFLGNDEILKEQETIEILSNEELQRQFICDSITDRKDKIKIIGYVEKSLSGKFEETNYEDINRMNIDYVIKIEYLYDSTKQPLSFELGFNGDNVSISANGDKDDGDYLTQPSYEVWFDYIDWSEINTVLYTNEGDEVNFIAIENAPYKIVEIFIRHYVEDFVTTESKMDYSSEIDNSVISQYC